MLLRPVNRGAGIRVGFPASMPLCAACAGCENRPMHGSVTIRSADVSRAGRYSAIIPPARRRQEDAERRGWLPGWYIPSPSRCRDRAALGAAKIKKPAYGGKRVRGLRPRRHCAWPLGSLGAEHPSHMRCPIASRFHLLNQASSE